VKNLCWSSRLLATFVIGSGSAYAAAGDLDQTFGTNGVTITSISGTLGIVNSILLQSDGSILVLVGDKAVLRYASAGALDTTFGDNGIMALAAAVEGSLALQPNGQILIGGAISPRDAGPELGAVRLNPDGSPDTSFGSNGVAAVSLGTRSPNVGSSALLQPDGNIVVCTTLISVGRGQPYQTALARFDSGGGVDTSFGNQGLSIRTGIGGCSALALLSDGDYLVVNGQLVAEFSTSGEIQDTVIGGDIVAVSQSSSAFRRSLFDPNGGYLLGTELFVGRPSRGHTSSAEVLRFDETGAVVFDSTFHYEGSGGAGIEAVVSGIALQSDGGIVVVGPQNTLSPSGTESVNGVARLTPDGNLDPSFGDGGTVVNQLPARVVVVQPDGNIVVAGFAINNTDLTLARYLGR
jgi:uncharacterized delta-60 repeat protein